MVGAAVFAGLFVLGTAAEHPWVLVVLVILGILTGARDSAIDVSGAAPV